MLMCVPGGHVTEAILVAAAATPTKKIALSPNLQFVEPSTSTGRIQIARVRASMSAMSTAVAIVTRAPASAVAAQGPEHIDTFSPTANQAAAETMTHPVVVKPASRPSGEIGSAGGHFFDRSERGSRRLVEPLIRSA
jgi:hypothetical protein